MNTLRIVLYEGSEISCKTTQKTALAAVTEWANKVSDLGLYGAPVLSQFIKVKNAQLLDEKGSIIDSVL